MFSGYLAVLMPRVHGVSPFLYLPLDSRQLILKELPHHVNVAAIQPVMINGDGVLLQDRMRKVTQDQDR